METVNPSIKNIAQAKEILKEFLSDDYSSVLIQKVIEVIDLLEQSIINLTENVK